MNVRSVLLILLALFAIGFIVAWVRACRGKRGAFPKPLQLGIGLVTDFLDTLGIGSFAVTTSLYKFLKAVPDERIPGTLNVGHTLPTIAEALIFIGIVDVQPETLLLLIASSIAGAWLGAGIVAKWPRRYVQIGMGLALVAAGTLFILKNLNILQGGEGHALGLNGILLAVGIAGNFVLGALMTIGIGLYAPAMIMVSLLGMSPLAAFPIMMGSCAFLMPVASSRFMRFNAYELQAALGLCIGGIPGVLAAAYLVKSLPLTSLRWLIAAVVIYTAIMMLRSAAIERRAALTPTGPGIATP